MTTNTNTTNTMTTNTNTNTNTEISTAAAALGRKGGSAKSEAKTARSNGAKGGRPLTLTGGKAGFTAAINEAFTTRASNPTIRYSHARGFFVESGIHRADDDVIWQELAYYNLNDNGNRSIRPSEYPGVRAAILESES